MRRGAAGALLFALLLPLAPASADQVARASSILRRAELPGMELGVVGTGRTIRSVGASPLLPRQALLGRSPLAATRALIEGHAGIDLPDAHTRAAADGTHETSRLGLTTGDLTGDGHPDVLAYEVASPVDIFSDDYRYALHGMDGKDGALLWSREYPARLDVLPTSSPDLTGDGRADLVVLTYDAEAQRLGPCNSGFCVQVEHQQHRWTLEVLSGATGTPSWSRQLDGVHGGVGVGLANIPPSFLSSDYVRITTAAAVVPLLSGDHNGDAIPDLVVNEFDEIRAGDLKYYRTAGATVISQRAATMLSTRALVLDGRSGAVLSTRTRDFTEGDAVLLPAGDAVGGGGTDLLWQASTDTRSPSVCYETAAGEDCAGIASSVLDLEMIDGQTLASAWETTIDRDALIWPFAEAPRADLTGDGRADVLLFEGLDDGDDYPSWSMGVVSGTSGGVVWRRPVQDYPNAVDRTLIDEVGGGGGQDLLDLDLVLNAPAQQFDWVLRRIDGATGEVLLVTERVISAQEGYLLSPVSDVDADGVPDIVLAHITRVRNEQTGQVETRSAVSLESGRTGQTFFALTEQGEAIPLDAGDLDADGMSDLVLYRAEAGMQLTGLQAISVAGGETLWSLATAPAGFDLERIADPAGAGSDLLLSRTRDTANEHRSRVDAIDGLEGKPRWSRGDAFPLDLLCSGSACD